MTLTSDPHRIIETFMARWAIATQRQIDLLLGQYGIPVSSLIHDSDGEGYPLAMLRVERTGRTFEFSDDPGLKLVCGFVARDRWGEAQDIVAWSPRDGWAGTWLGRAALLNEHEVSWPRMGDPLPVYSNVLLWLQAGRSGCVVLDGKRARRDLEGVKLSAVNVEEGLTLRKLLSAPDPRIVVPAQAADRMAA